jgi:predicted DNA-binding helix-hairpin-helix protein
MIIGASSETDQQILNAADKLYKNYNLKRVYYSGYIPVADDNRLPVLGSAPPLLRENRLYQSDWLIRYYGFSVQELLDERNPNLDPTFNPKLSWALRNRHLFPIDINKADYEQILRIPGIGVKSAKKIVSARKFGKLNWEQLVKIGISLNTARYFLVCKNKIFYPAELLDDILKSRILASSTSKFLPFGNNQLSLF